MRTLRRLSIVILPSIALISSAPCQVWEKYIAPGLTYRMELDTATPRMIHALHFNFHSDQVHASPELGDAKMYEDNKTKGRSTVSDLVKRTGAIAAVNANYFPYTGRPVGLMVRERELISSPMEGRAVFGWGQSAKTAFGRSSFTASFKAQDGSPVSIDSINDECPADRICLDTDAAGLALTKGGTGTYALVRPVGSGFSPNCTVEGEVLYLYSDSNKMPIQAGNAVLVGTGVKAQTIGALRPGEKVTISVQTDGLDWSKVDNCVCGGPFLVRGGAPSVDAAEEGFKPEFYAKRHARTALGRDTLGDLWLVVVDGRQSCSVGATLDELAQIMIHLGCVEAINLDGGGSSTFNIFGLTVNRPSDGIEREVANGIVFYGPMPQAQTQDIKINTPEGAKIGDKLQLEVVMPDGGAVPNSEVLWSASGSGWIDQGGLLRIAKSGPTTVRAFVHGQLISAIVAGS